MYESTTQYVGVSDYR